MNTTLNAIFYTILVILCTTVTILSIIGFGNNEMDITAFVAANLVWVVVGINKWVDSAITSK